jgi:hypothetical protein
VEADMHISFPQAFACAQVNNSASWRVRTVGKMKRVEHLKEYVLFGKRYLEAVITIFFGNGVEIKLGPTELPI